jgi:hypothetical protein
MGLKKGTVTTNAKFRVTPSPRAREMPFINFTDTGAGPAEEKLAYIPADTSVVILARTEQKVKVQQWENYWLYLEVEEPLDQWKKGWVFGEFIKFD